MFKDGGEDLQAGPQFSTTDSLKFSSGLIAGRLSKRVSLRTKLATEAPVNGGRNYDGPKVAKFLVG